MKLRVLYITLFLLASAYALPLGAQERKTISKVSMYNSLKGVGASIDIPRDHNTFDNFILSTDFEDVLTARVGNPGYKLTYFHCFDLGHFKDYEGIDAHVYAGPGMSLGYVRSNQRHYGVATALAGVIGMEEKFSDHLAISIQWSMDVGIFLFHFNHQEILSSEQYYSGAKRIWMPEIKLTYCL